MFDVNSGLVIARIATALGYSWYCSGDTILQRPFIGHACIYGEVTIKLKFCHGKLFEIEYNMRFICINCYM